MKKVLLAGLMFFGFLLNFSNISVSFAQTAECEAACSGFNSINTAVCNYGTPLGRTGCVDLGFSACQVPSDSNVSCWCCDPLPTPTIPLPVGEARPKYGGGVNYPFPCNLTAPKYASSRDQEEFHSLRPYQASPCNPNLEDLAISCGNNIYVGDEIAITKTYSTDGRTYSYIYNSNKIIPNLPIRENYADNLCYMCSSTTANQCISTGISPCIPEFVCDPSGMDYINCGICSINSNPGGPATTETCAFTIPGSRTVSVDMTESDFPIMGYTEPSEGNEDLAKPKVTNSIYTSEEPETMDNATKMNEYVSWYLNGVLGRAEYPYWDTEISCVGESTNRTGWCMQTRIDPNGLQECLVRPPGIASVFFDPYSLGGLLNPDGKDVCIENTYCCVTPLGIFNKETGAVPGHSLVVDYSGPIKKLLPFSLQNQEKIAEIADAQNTVKAGFGIRHDQVVGCTLSSPPFELFGMSLSFGNSMPVGCYRDWSLPDFNWDIPNYIGNLFTEIRQMFDMIENKERYRLSSYSDNLPPVEEDYIGQNGFEQIFQPFINDYKRWRGMTCTRIFLPLPIINSMNLCFNFSLTNPAVFGNLFPYVPMSSTEDRLGRVTIERARNTQYSPAIRIISSNVTSTGPINLFVPHMEESVDLAELLQNTYAFKDSNTAAYSTFRPSLEKSPYCSYVQARSNPGDDLFAGQTTATINYSAEVQCTFFLWGGVNNVPYGNLCQNLAGGECVDSASSCATSYGPYDCANSNQICGVGCDPLPGRNECLDANTDPTILQYSCVPSSYTGANCDNAGYSCGSPGYKCVELSGNDCTPPAPGTYPTQDCTQTALAGMRVKTETPLANEAWTRLVSGASGIFRKMFPLPGSDAPISGIADIPGSTDATYSSSGDGALYSGSPLAESPGSNAKIYFPHIGGIKEYFLTGIQSMLRPKGTGRSVLYGAPETQIKINPNAQCRGLLFQNYNPPTQTTARASYYFNTFVVPKIEKYPELLLVYANAEEITGVPCEVLAGIHCREGGCNPNKSLISGEYIGEPEPDAGNQIFSTLLETAIWAGIHLKSKSGGSIDSWNEMITAVSWYNGGGNANCSDNRCPPVTGYTGPCPGIIGVDDPYAMAWIDNSRLQMYLRFCADLTCCDVPREYDTPGILTYAIEFFRSGILNNR